MLIATQRPHPYSWRNCGVEVSTGKFICAAQLLKAGNMLPQVLTQSTKIELDYRACHDVCSAKAGNTELVFILAQECRKRSCESLVAKETVDTHGRPKA